MRDLNESNVTDAVLNVIADDTNPRLKEIMEALIRHSHDLIREVNLTPDELLYGARFIQDVGHISDDKREEGVLLGDVLGLTALVEILGDRVRTGATESSLLGPFYREGAPAREMGFDISLGDDEGEPAFLHGRVLDSDGHPIEGVTLDLWQTSPNMFYEAQVGQPKEYPDYAYRGKFKTGTDGRYWFRSRKPADYPVPTDGPVGLILNGTGRHSWRPAHLHYLIYKDGYQTIQTEMFNSDSQYLDSDAVFGVKESLIIPYVEIDDATRAQEYGFDGRFYEGKFDFVMKDDASVKDAEAAYGQRASMSA
ncbi:MAG: 6-chlorohydroxyquinol-1,2-dioxygenase [Rhodospirillaceae bacterium]|nr:6-chlorohydroxyquinol-1,2-dioxygenase [Rhodospirillaceae bacterium]|tara:strand:+ start:2751 stop:3677 length:927 start_codon:yes stop_codon:yes gene_type:complete